MHTHRIRALKLAITTLLLVLTGCAANFGGQKGKFVARSSLHANQFALTSSESDGDYDCSLGVNVTRYYDPYADGTGSYKVCVSRTNERAVRVQGRSHSPTGVACVIPANDFNYASHFGFRDAHNRIVHQCVAVSPSGATIDFTPVLGQNRMNLVHIVEVEDLTEMLAGLAAFNVAACPAARSYGALPALP